MVPQFQFQIAELDKNLSESVAENDKLEKKLLTCKAQASEKDSHGTNKALTEAQSQEPNNDLLEPEKPQKSVEAELDTSLKTLKKVNRCKVGLDFFYLFFTIWWRKVKEKRCIQLGDKFFRESHKLCNLCKLFLPAGPQTHTSCIINKINIQATQVK